MLLLDMEVPESCSKCLCCCKMPDNVVLCRNDMSKHTPMDDRCIIKGVVKCDDAVKIAYDERHKDGKHLPTDCKSDLEFPHALGEVIEMWVPDEYDYVFDDDSYIPGGRWIKGKIVAGYRYMDGIVTIEAEDGKQYSCAEFDDSKYHKCKEGDKSDNT